MILTSKNDWEQWRNKGIINSDDILVEMIREMVDTIHQLEHIYGDKARIVSSSMIMEYYALTQIAFSRGIDNYQRL